MLSVALFPRRRCEDEEQRSEEADAHSEADWRLGGAGRLQVKRRGQRHGAAADAEEGDEPVARRARGDADERGRALFAAQHEHQKQYWVSNLGSGLGWDLPSGALRGSGATFSYDSGLQADSPCTPLAPCSATCHPILLEVVDPTRAQGLLIYLMHGALDWMFPVSVAQEANTALSAAGAKVEYREIENLSHTYPQEENPAILRWLAEDVQPAH